APRATEQAVAGAGGGLYCTSVSYQDVGFAFSVGSRARRLVRAIAAALDEPEDLTLDLIHVFGQQAWGLGAELARMTGARLVLEAWSAVLLPATARAPGAGGAKRGS